MPPEAGAAHRAAHDHGLEVSLPLSGFPEFVKTRLTKLRALIEATDAGICMKALCLGWTPHAASGCNDVWPCLV